MKIAVIGAGPSGSYLSYLLATSGLPPLLFDGSHPREKPCGAILSSDFPSLFPILKNFSHHEIISYDHYYTTPKQRHFKIDAKHSNKKYLVTQRKHLDSYLLEKAKTAGTHWIQEHVTDIKNLKNQWEITTNKNQKFQADLIIGADGAKSLVRKKTIGTYKHIDFFIGMGYRFPDQKISYMQTIILEEGAIGFLLPGYRQTQIILGFKKGKKYNKKHLDQFHKKYFPQGHSPQFFSAIQPFPSHPYFLKEPRTGDNFLLIGDSAGFCNPKNGEGIYYALKSAELASKTILTGNIKNFEHQWRNHFGKELKKATQTIKGLPIIPLLELGSIFLSKSPSLTTLAYHLAKGTLLETPLKTHLSHLIKTPIEILTNNPLPPPPLQKKTDKG